MKKASSILILFAMILVFGTGPELLSQQSQPSQEPGNIQEDKEELQRMKDEQKAREAEMKVQLEEELKMKREMMKAQEAEMRAQEAEMRAQQKEMEEQVRAEHAERAARARVRAEARGSSRSSYSYATRAYPEDTYVEYIQPSQSQLTLRNTFQGGSDTSQGTFEVEEDTRRFRCMINGKVRSGSITIKISYPGGKSFKDLTINSSAEVSFSQVLNISEGKGDKYIGEWEYEVKADKAEGTYMLQISTN